jgi:polyisoprenoid-binding protein YceI
LIARTLKFLVLTALSGLCAFAQSTSWRIDPAHSSAQFSVRHMMIATVRGQFGGVKGTLTFDPKSLSTATVEATIDCSTVNTGDPKRDSDLRTGKFFDIARYPTMKFKSTHVEPNGEGKLKVTGDLTINAATRQVVLDVEGPTPPIRDAQGRPKIGANATTKISRKAFGIVYNPVLEGGGVTVGDEVTINLDLEFIKKQG